MKKKHGPFTFLRPYRWSAARLAHLRALTLKTEAPAQIRRDRFLAFGTLVEIAIRVDNTAKEALAGRAFQMLKADFARWHRDWHAWNSGRLQRLNRALAEGGWVDAPALIPLIERAKALSAASRGLFNPAIGRLIEQWGFAGGDLCQNALPPTAVSPPECQSGSMEDIEIQGSRVRTRNPAVMLDFGGFAKGYAIDRAIETLRRLGIEDAIVNAGGDLRAIGCHSDRPWNIGIRHPRGEGLIAWLAINDGEAAFTSGDYERFFEYRGKRYQHSIDPRYGYPVADTISATVVHPRADLADAATTALLVAGPDQWFDVATAMGVDQAMLIDARGQVHISAALAERVDFVDAPATPPPG